MDKKEKLKKKLKYWIEHNKEHAETFRGAAKEAGESGLKSIQDELLEATNAMDNSTKHLLNALERCKSATPPKGRGL